MSITAKNLEVTEVAAPTCVINTPEVIEFTSELNLLATEDVTEKIADM